jgi:hypothetical protein
VHEIARPEVVLSEHEATPSRLAHENAAAPTIIVVTTALIVATKRWLENPTTATFSD